jgi:hypothetical protein
MVSQYSKWFKRRVDHLDFVVEGMSWDALALCFGEELDTYISEWAPHLMRHLPHISERLVALSPHPTDSIPRCLQFCNKPHVSNGVPDLFQAFPNC